MAFWRQAATQGNKRWSEVNSTLYAICFTGKSQDHPWCELCLAKSHRTGECLLQGHDKTELTPWQNHAVAVQTTTSTGGPVRVLMWRQLPPSGEICKLWNENRCRHPIGAGICTYVCSVEATIPE